MKLVDCFIPLLALVRQFQRQPGDDAATLAAQCDNAISDARHHAHDTGYSDADTEEALFAVAAWADEMLLATQWNGAAQWQRRLLQRRYFNISNAGVAFFMRLDKLGPQQLAVREVYYLCLGMGFVGRYGYEHNLKALTEIKRANQVLLQGDDGLSSEAGRMMFPDGYGALVPSPSAHKNVKNQRWKLSSLTVNTLLMPLLILLVLYGIYHIIIHQLVNAILPQISI